MMRLPTRREGILLALAAGVVALSLSLAHGGRDDDAVVEPVATGKADKPRRKPEVVASAADLDLARLRRRAGGPEPVNAFGSRSWYVPPPPPPPPPKVEPPPPSAPPLPFSYLGRFVEGGVPTYFLARGDRVLTVKEGDILEGIYRVDGVEGSNMNLTFLPLNIRQSLDVGSAG